ncbi:hypothetical protein A3D91_01680 [candidate division WWE3 bacterium RIFCSPHIGHO2_02_FULL_38_14]|uniref:TRAM domain-containing protein n=1 Tax=candidate division WWE3 bacterium RIFCSPHIGHO2_02_FULL_38_14 TaxID=1802620 RepID=A0A1F4VAN2_UNCKA|nr:MAG: hypothetical protein A3D91_01680 [candidate division WWE3 bacterium RIFCSPHIGHO2_02_FULL_38_14]
MLNENTEVRNQTKNNNGTAQKQRLLLPPPKQRYKSSDVRLHIRLLVGFVLFIIGFNFSNTVFFRENPLFGINFLAEILISFTSLLFGAFILPVLFLELRAWFETTIAKIIADIVNNFWVQQNRRLHEAQKAKQEQKTQALELKKREDEKRKAEERRKEEEEKKRIDEISNSILLDTSVLIDGRVLDMVRSGFIDRSLIIPKAVLDELHLISDNSDVLRRQRGRRGLDLVGQLKRYAKVVILDEKPKEGEEGKTDKQLVTLARKYKSKLMTLDFNLNKVAKVSGVKVLNINELVDAVKTVVLPGEIIKVKIMQEGKEKQQGVGYLPDGTMIVVEDAKDKVGTEVETKVFKVIQSPAGKMIFCKL